MDRLSDKTIKKFNSRMQAKLLLVFCVITLLLVVLMGRLIYITQTKGDKYAKHVLSRETYVSSVLPYKRGDITDRNGTVLARSELQYKLILDPKRLSQNKDCIPITLAALKDNFGIDAETVQAIMTDEVKKESQYVILQKNIKYDLVQSYEAYVENFKKTKKKEDKTSVVGIWFEEEYVRSYPYASLACDVLGFTSTDNTGFWGIEEYYNNELNGTNGREYGYYDSDLNIERIVKKAVNGNSVISSIDINAQRIIQEHIVQFNTEFGSKNIGVLIMNPNNGEIIAMASNQEYDLNNPRKLEGIIEAGELSAMTEDQKIEALNALWKNDVITSSFEPGSTYKPITIAAGLEENIVSEEDTYYCDGFEEFTGIKPIKCSKRTGHGDITLGESLMYSCNDALMQIAAKEGRDVFHLYQNSFGIGKKTGIDLPGEGAGITMSRESLNTVELATNSFGQSFNVTMIQMAAAYSSLVNGGNYYQPHIMKKIVNDNGATVKEFDKLLVRQTVSEKTSEFIQKYMYQTVEAGTANGAKVEGYAIGGKTGTAQKLPRDAKTYVVSFLGAVPAINPEIVIYVMIDEPQNVVKQADSSIATTFASRIMKNLLPALGIFPEGEIDYLLPTDDETTGDGEQGKTSTPDTENAGNTGNTGNNENSENSENSENNQTEGNDDAANSEDQQNQEDTQTNGDDTEEDSEIPDDDSNTNEDEGENPQNSQTNRDQGEPDTEGDNANQPEGQTDIPAGEDEFNPDALE
jgi:stage V sporulation protein D (sporulation-specific penicillin-binding protein)